MKERRGQDWNEKMNDWTRKQRSIDWDGKAFKKMKNLKTLILSSSVCFSEAFNHIPNSLRVLEYCNRNPNPKSSNRPYVPNASVHTSNPFEWKGLLTEASVTYLHLFSYINTFGLILFIYFLFISIFCRSSRI